MNSEFRYLLIVSCSQRKRSDAGLLPAIERYDGPAFRLLRRFLRGQPSAPLDTYILSAKFGLIPSDCLIPDYDQEMTRQRAGELHPEVIAGLTHILGAKSYEQLFIYLGRDYLRAFDGYETLVPAALTVRIAEGGSGKKLSELHEWLYGETPARRYSPPTGTPQGKARLRGIELVLTPAQVFEIARTAVAVEKDDSTRYKWWYVVVDGQRVAPKWLVSKLTGLPVSAFTADEARRVLGQLGVQVRHINETVSDSNYEGA